MESQNKNKLSKIFTGEIGLFIILIAMVVIFSVSSPHFLKQQNLLNITRQVSIAMVVGMGMLGVVLTGEIDLSVGSCAAVTGVACAYTMNHTGSILLGVLASLALGVFIGLANGLFVVYGKIPSFIVTLSSMGILRGVAMVWTNGKPISKLNPAFSFLGAGYVAKVIPMATVVALAITVIFYIFLEKTKHGIYIKAIGANSEAAVLSTIPLKKYKILVFVISGLMSAVGGLITTSKLLSATPTASDGLEMDVLSGVILGGASLSGGVGTVLGAFAGTLIIGVMNNGLNLMGVNSYWQSIVKGVIILLAVLVKRDSNK